MSLTPQRAPLAPRVSDARSHAFARVSEAVSARVSEPFPRMCGTIWRAAHWLPEVSVREGRLVISVASELHAQR